MKKLSIRYPEGFPVASIDKDQEILKENGIESDVDIQPMQMYAALEWVVPTLVVAWIAKPYFEGFFNEAGKAHFEALVKCLKELSRHGKEHEAKRITATKSTDKNNDSYTQSLMFSIVCELASNRKIKLLFDDKLSLKDWEAGIERFFDLLLADYSNPKKSKLSKKLSKLSQKEYHSLYALINRKTKKLEFHDDLTLMKLSREKKKN